MYKIELEYRSRTGRNIVKKRKEFIMNQKEFCEALNCSVTLISQIECGHKRPSAKMLQKICKVLRCTAQDLLPSEEELQEIREVYGE